MTTVNKLTTCSLILIVGLFSAAPIASARNTKVSATLQNFKIKLSKSSAKPGTVTFKARNSEGTHTICIKGNGVSKCADIVGKGETTTLKAKLRKKGKYTVYCSVDGHQNLGMKTRFRIV